MESTSEKRSIESEEKHTESYQEDAEQNTNIDHQK